MDNLTPQLNSSQLKANIDALQKGGMTNDKVQAYVNNYKADGRGGYILANQPASTPQAQSQPLVGGLVGDAIKPLADQTQGHAANIVQDFSSKPSFGGALDVVGNVAAETGDILGAGLKAVTPQPIQDALSGAAKAAASTPAAKAILTAWNNFQAQHPDLAKGIGNAVNIAALFGGEAASPTVDEAAQGLKEGASVAKNMVTDAAKAVVGKSEVSAAKTDAFIKNLVTPQMTAKDLTGAIKTGKVTEATGLIGERDVTGALPNLPKIQKAVAEVPGISAKNTLLENANAIHDHIATIANDLKTQIQGKGFFSPNQFRGYMDSVKNNLIENPLITGDAEKTAQKIMDKFSSLVAEKGHTPSGLLDARKALDSWMAAQKGAGVFDPAKESAISTALRAIRQGGNKFLADRVPSVDVKGLLSKQSSLYDAIENIAPKAAKEGSSGFKQFVKAHPTLIKAIEYTAGGIGAGEVLKHTGILP